MMTTDELAEYIQNNLDPDAVVELLDLSSKALVYAFYDDIVERYDRIIDVLDLEEEHGEDTP